MVLRKLLKKTIMPFWKLYVLQQAWHSLLSIVIVQEVSVYHTQSGFSVHSLKTQESKDFSCCFIRVFPCPPLKTPKADTTVPPTGQRIVQQQPRALYQALAKTKPNNQLSWLLDFNHFSYTVHLILILIFPPKVLKFYFNHSCLSQPSLSDFSSWRSETSDTRSCPSPLRTRLKKYHQTLPRLQPLLHSIIFAVTPWLPPSSIIGLLVWISVRQLERSRPHEVSWQTEK